MAQIFDDPMKSPLLEAFSKMPASISEADQTNLKNRAARTYKEAVVPAFTKFHQFLISRYLPACREATSAAALPNGAEKWHTTTNQTAQEIHQIGLSEIHFFRENAAKTDQDIIVEVDRYIVWPGQALGFKKGQLKIQELRTRAARQLGSRFDIRQFHDIVLGQGSVPMDLLEQQVNAWIQNA